MKADHIPDVLARIVDDKRSEVAASKRALPPAQLRAQASRRGPARGFYAALSAPGVNLIAEIKKASPSGGLIRPDFDPAAIATIYQNAGAAALSVLTDAKYFQGSLDYLAVVRAAATLPILRKDFIIDEYQILEAERRGADAILLIVACLDVEQLRDFRQAAEALGLDALVEVHDDAELDVALKSGARIVGINNRNLKTLKTDLETTFRVAAQLPPFRRSGLLLVSESGISRPEHVARLRELGVNAVLIGEAFMRAPDIAAKVREVMG